MSENKIHVSTSEQGSQSVTDEQVLKIVQHLYSEMEAEEK
jgi:hypothetical protein